MWTVLITTVTIPVWQVTHTYYTCTFFSGPAGLDSISQRTLTQTAANADLKMQHAFSVIKGKYADRFLTDQGHHTVLLVHSQVSFYTIVILHKKCRFGLTIFVRNVLLIFVQWYWQTIWKQKDKQLMVIFCISVLWYTQEYKTSTPHTSVMIGDNHEVPQGNPQACIKIIIWQLSIISMQLTYTVYLGIQASSLLISRIDLRKMRSQVPLGHRMISCSPSHFSTVSNTF